MANCLGPTDSESSDRRKDEISMSVSGLFV